jgi:tetratricopeptide (TPR) repeat protein
MRLNETFSLKTTKLALAFAVASGLVLAAIPLFGTLGPESALVLGVLIPPWAAALGARSIQRAKAKQTPISEALLESAGSGLLLVAIPSVVLALNAVRMRTCDPLEGLTFVALGPMMGCLLAACTGAFIGTLVPSSRRATLCAVLVPLVGIAAALYDFVNTPAIFAFGHYFGYFPGTFYDRRIEIPDALLSLRLIDGVICIVLGALTLALGHAQSAGEKLHALSRHPITCALLIVCGVSVAMSARHAAALGHVTSADHIADRLGRVVESARCRLVVPRELDIQEAERIAEDCDFRIGQLEQLLDVKEDARVVAFFFRSQAEKRVLMGAARVYIAKPWRREVYLNLSEWPHPVLSHELAHVVARHAARGPFGIAGHLGGLIPEPTLIEGLAVALEPVARDELTPHQWTKAARIAGVSEKLRALLGASFLGKNQALAYTLAGSFLRHILDTRGAEKVREIYRTADVVGALGKSWDELEQEWWKSLEAIPLPARAEALARARFQRPSVFSAVCPHQVEKLSQQLQGALAASDTIRAVETCRAMLDIDPRDPITRAAFVTTLAQAGDIAQAERELTVLEKLRAPAPIVAQARAGLADASFERGDFERARAIYRDLLDEPQSDAELRQIEVKLLGLESPQARSAVAELLLRGPGRSGDLRIAMHAIQELKTRRKDGLGSYLEARQLSAARRHDLSHPLVLEALRRGLPTRRLRSEALRLRGLTAFAIGALDDASSSFAALLAEPDVSEASRLEVTDWRERIAFRRARYKQ